ncbi:MAG: hypothetical protein IKJ44_06405, partial [Elusimicrobiaceae bacterium]|nr:hypothetical protein [Elusimicrobiaceae bacterium]
MKFNKFFGLLPVVILLSGCMMGPNYKRPQLDLPTTVAADDYSVFENYLWWHMFEDETLNALENEA